ncbi:hypothetical protein RB595_010682 [Gaeumannomyces hyphopodioides]
MAGFPINNAPFSRSSYIDDADFFDDDPARYSPPFSDEEYAEQMGYVHRNNIVDEYLDGFEVFEDDEEEQQFALSMANTPVTEVPPLRPTRRATISTSRSGLQPTKTFADLAALGAAMASASSDSKACLTRSRPIAIEMPSSRRIRSRDPPSAPLSARGDLPGGYFPEHEDPETRVHRPHPFHADANEARRQSIAKANEESSSPQNGANNKNGRQAPTNGPASALPVPSLPAVTEAPAPHRHRSAKDPELPSTDGSSTNPPAPYGAYSYTIDQTATTSIASYNPTGAEDNMLPMGKYYPTNWENRKRAKKEKKEREAMLLEEQFESWDSTSPSRSPLGPTLPSDNSPVASTSASAAALAPTPVAASGPVKATNPNVARTRAAATAPPPMMGHSRSDSEARRRLQQYQRDMITQATMAATRLLGSQIQQRGPEDVLRSLNTIPALRNLQLNSPPGARSRSGQAVPSLSVSSSSISSASPASIANGGGLAAVMAAGGSFGMLAKPLSPRLEPLGSPGPVTPIDLSHTETAATNAGGLLAVARPRMPIAVATAPPAAGPRVEKYESEPSFPFAADGH